MSTAQRRSDMRQPADWMVPMDDEILELFHSAHLVLTPSIIAYNIDHSREEVNRRLSALEDKDLIERVERAVCPVGEGLRFGGSISGPHGPRCRKRTRRGLSFHFLATSAEGCVPGSRCCLPTGGG